MSSSLIKTSVLLISVVNGILVALNGAPTTFKVSFLVVLSVILFLYWKDHRWTKYVLLNFATLLVFVSAIAFFEVNTTLWKHIFFVAANIILIAFLSIQELKRT